MKTFLAAGLFIHMYIYIYIYISTFTSCVFFNFVKLKLELLSRKIMRFYFIISIVHEKVFNYKPLVSDSRVINLFC